MILVYRLFENKWFDFVFGFIILCQNWSFKLLFYQLCFIKFFKYLINFRTERKKNKVRIVPTFLHHTISKAVKLEKGQ